MHVDPSNAEEVRPEIGRKVIVVGGGIGGLYGARLLAGKGYEVTLLERRDRLGGRIETVDMRGFSSPESQTRRSSFKAEFGPMRFEPSIQPRIEGLCTELGIEFTAFPPPLDAPSPSRHRLAEDEHDDGGQPLGALQLLKLGVFRMFGQKTTFDGEQRVVLDDPSWLDQLDDDIEDGFDHLRRTAALPATGTKLHDTGFWNALSQVLSGEAVEKIKDLGTFYHLLPENPNAVEWGIFWLRLFKLPPGGKLHGIPEGVRLLTERLEGEFRTRYRDRVKIYLQHEVVRLTPGASGGVEVHGIKRRTGADESSRKTHRTFCSLPRRPRSSRSPRRFRPRFRPTWTRLLDSGS